MWCRVGQRQWRWLVVWHWDGQPLLWSSRDIRHIWICVILLLFISFFFLIYLCLTFDTIYSYYLFDHSICCYYLLSCVVFLPHLLCNNSFVVGSLRDGVVLPFSFFFFVLFVFRICFFFHSNFLVIFLFFSLVINLFLGSIFNFFLKTY